MTTETAISVMESCVVRECDWCIRDEMCGGDCDSVRKVTEAINMSIKALYAQQEAAGEPQTNADYIRSMDDEALADFLCAEGWMLGEVKECLEWIQQPYKGGENDG